MKFWRKTKLWCAGFVASATMLVASVALAQTPTPTPTPVPEGDLAGALEQLPNLIQAISGKDWEMAAALILMLAVFTVRSYLWKKINKRWIPISTALMAAATYTSGALYVGTDALPAVIQGLEVGTSAVGLWELIKSLRKSKKAEANAPTNASPDAPSEPANGE